MRRLILKISILAAFIATYSTAVVSQSEKSNLFDSFGLIPECDVINRMDLMMIELQREKDSRAVIIYYFGANELPGMNRIAFQLTNIRNTIDFRNGPKDRIKIVRGGFRKEISFEFFVFPKEDSDPKPTLTIPKPRLPEKLGFKWARLSWNDGGERFRSLDSLTKEDLLLREEIGDDSSDLVTDEEFESLPSGVSPRLTNYLKSKKDASLLIYYYSDTRYYDNSKIESEIKTRVGSALNEQGISEDRLIYKYGGFKDYQMVLLDFWVIDRTLELPKPEPDNKKVEN